MDVKSLDLRDTRQLHRNSVSQVACTVLCRRSVVSKIFLVCGWGSKVRIPYEAFKPLSLTISIILRLMECDCEHDTSIHRAMMTPVVILFNGPVPLHCSLHFSCLLSYPMQM